MPIGILPPCGMRGHVSLPKHNEARQLPWEARQMFDLVADVARYGEFLPWVSAVRVRSNSDTEMVADMIVGFKGLRRHKVDYLGMARGGLEILAHCQKINIGAAHVIHHLMHFHALLAQPHHHAGFGED